MCTRSFVWLSSFTGMALVSPATVELTPGAQTSIMQNLTYFEHLSEPMAELLAILEKEFDYTQLTEEVLRCVLVFRRSP